MWFLKFYLLVMLFTAFPMLFSYWILFTDSGNKPARLLAASLFLGTILYPMLFLSGQIEAGVGVMMYLIFLCVFWVLGTLVGIAFWGIFIITLELVLFMIRTVFDDFKFSLVGYIFNKM